MLLDILYEVVQDSGCSYLDVQVSLAFLFHLGYNYINETIRKTSFSSPSR